MKKILSLLVVLFSTWSGNVAFAQFYDDEDEILFYQCVLLNGEVNASTNNNSYVFNFDGNKATTFGHNITDDIKRNLKNNNNYYEGKVFDATFDVKYRPDLSSSSWIVYSRYQTSYYIGPWTSYWYFSRDRKTMIRKESGTNDEWTYKLVEKSYYVEEGRRRSNLNDEKIYE